MSASIREISDVREIQGGGEFNGGGEIHDGSTRTMSLAWKAARKETWWSQHREASLNWLAFGVLLAAWNVADNGTAMAVSAPRRPQALRGYSSVSVRAATLHSVELRSLPTHP